MGTRIIALWLMLVGVTLRPSHAQAEGSVGGLFDGCIGDCNDDLRVTIDEIVLDVRIALGESPDTACPNGGPGSTINGLTMAVANSLGGCFALRDFSDFSRFELNQREYYGFCPQIGDLYRGSIGTTEEGWVVARTVVERGTSGVDDCFRDYPECLVLRVQPCRLLTPAERDRVSQAFEQVKIWTTPDAFCIYGIADPCLVTAMKWDEFVTSDFIHSGPRLDAAEVPRIAELIRSLGEGPEISCPEP